MSDEKSGVRRVYLDQSAYGNMIDGGDGDWRKSELGGVLSESQATGRAAVWVGPTNVIEAVQRRSA